MGWSLNKAMLIGNLGGDPETFNGREGGKVVTFLLATDYKSGGRAGVKVTTWHRVKCFSKLADIAEEWLYKGAKVYVEGRIDNWYTEDGKHGSDLLCNELILLSGRDDAAAERERAPEPPEQYRRGKQPNSGYERRDRDERHGVAPKQGRAPARGQERSPARGQERSPARGQERSPARGQGRGAPARSPRPAPRRGYEDDHSFPPDDE